MKASISTSHGTIELELDTAAAAETCANFKQYADDGHYDNTIFHRVIPNFMIQGGGFTSDMDQKPTRASIKNEANNGLTNLTGTIAMARTNEPHSASSQFFINLVDNDFLNHRDTSDGGYGYAVFGKTVSGEDVIHAIAGVTTGQHGMHGDVPTEAVVITSITVTA